MHDIQRMDLHSYIGMSDICPHKNLLLHPPINFGITELAITQTRLPNHQVYTKHMLHIHD
jgi:hypothetical protein